MACVNGSSHNYSALDKDMKVVICPHCGDTKKTPFWTEPETKDHNMRIECGSVLTFCYSARISGHNAWHFPIGQYSNIDRDNQFLQSLVIGLGWSYSFDSGVHTIKFPIVVSDAEKVTEEVVSALKTTLYYEIPFDRYPDIRRYSSGLVDLLLKNEITYFAIEDKKVHVFSRK